MAIEIERLHKILLTKKNYFEKKIQDFIDRGICSRHNLELQYKE